MIDIIITTFNRCEFLRRTIDAILRNTEQGSYRLFINDDCSDDGTQSLLARIEEKGIAKVIYKQQREGVVPGFNALWDSVNGSDSEYICYLQDDAMPTERGWLLTLIQAYEFFREPGRIGFFSGYHAFEHPITMSMSWRGRMVHLKESSTATNLIATKEFWKSVGIPIPVNNPDGKKRGFPDHGVGSQIDLWLTGCQSLSRFVRWAASPTCSHTQGKKVLVVPGLIEHLGKEKRDSCWRQNRAGGY
jgi:glycosyltransferase involved in cell wall biosynthesis